MSLVWGLNVLQVEKVPYFIGPLSRSCRDEEMSEIDVALYLHYFIAGWVIFGQQYFS